MMNNKTASEAIDNTELYPQYWFLVVSVTAFLFYIAWDQKYVSSIWALDKSYMAGLIGLLVVFATCHAAYHVTKRSRSINTIQRILQNKTIDPNLPNDPLISSFIDDLSPIPTQNLANYGESASDSIVEIHADSLRAPIDLGWFLVDLAIRLGLLGTIIGFILIFTSLSNITLDGAEGLQALLVSMSGGMGTALLTTLSGLIAASFLSIQYLILGRQAEVQIALLIRLRNRYMTVSGK